MPVLGAPTPAVRESFLAAMDEFVAEDRGGPGDDSMIGRELREFGATWASAAGFAAYVAALRAQELEETPRPAGIVPCTTLWYVDGDAYHGRIAIRHRLTEHLLAAGGHIGYDVRPTSRRRGYATAMLGEALPIARGLGIERVLITCDTGNVASRKVIEHHGGRLEDERGGKLRFWIERD